jgi:hypothetical protein
MNAFEEDLPEIFNMIKTMISVGKKLDLGK